jgi:hypothetical protein
MKNNDVKQRPAKVAQVTPNVAHLARTNPRYNPPNRPGTVGENVINMEFTLAPRCMARITQSITEFIQNNSPPNPMPPIIVFKMNFMNLLSWLLRRLRVDHGLASPCSDMGGGGGVFAFLRTIRKGIPTTKEMPVVKSKDIGTAIKMNGSRYPWCKNTII